MQLDTPLLTGADELSPADPVLERRMKQAPLFGLAMILTMVLFGVGVMVWGLFYWPPNTGISGFWILVSGVYLVLSTVGIYLWILRSLRQTIISAQAVPAGIQVRLQRGGTRTALWSDPALALNLWRSGHDVPDSSTKYGMEVKMDSIVRKGRLTAEGYTKLIETATRRGLTVTTKRVGNGTDEKMTTAIRGPAAMP